MEGYTVENDGKIHTRYTDLVRCTEGQVLKVAREMLFHKERYNGAATSFGRTRHEMFADESLDTGRTPQCFQELEVELSVRCIEKEFAMEVFPGVVVHSRTDAYAPDPQLIIDYKTFTNSGDLEKYKRSKQHLMYALQLMNIGKGVKGALYLGEMWDAERENLLGYGQLEVPISLKDLVEFRNGWLKDRCERLVVAIDYLKNNSGIVHNLE